MGGRSTRGVHGWPSNKSPDTARVILVVLLAVDKVRTARPGTPWLLDATAERMRQLDEDNRQLRPALAEALGAARERRVTGATAPRDPPGKRAAQIIGPCWTTPPRPRRQHRPRHNMQGSGLDLATTQDQQGARGCGKEVGGSESAGSAGTSLASRGLSGPPSGVFVV